MSTHLTLTNQALRLHSMLEELNQKRPVNAEHTKMISHIRQKRALSKMKPSVGKALTQVTVAGSLMPSGKKADILTSSEGHVLILGVRTREEHKKQKQALTLLKKIHMDHIVPRSVGGVTFASQRYGLNDLRQKAANLKRFSTFNSEFLKLNEGQIKSIADQLVGILSAMFKVGLVHNQIDCLSMLVSVDKEDKVELKLRHWGDSLSFHSPESWSAWALQIIEENRKRNIITRMHSDIFFYVTMEQAYEFAGKNLTDDEFEQFIDGSDFHTYQLRKELAWDSKILELNKRTGLLQKSLALLSHRF